MSSGDFLIGGSSSSTRVRRRSTSPTQELPPPMVGWRFIALLVIAGGAFLSVGVWRVNTVFSVRDHEIETRRLQDVVQKRRDKTVALQSRVADLRRGESLRAAAAGALEMYDPETRQIEVLEIPAITQARWEAAARGVSNTIPTQEVTDSHAGD